MTDKQKPFYSNATFSKRDWERIFGEGNYDVKEPEKNKQTPRKKTWHQTTQWR